MANPELAAIDAETHAAALRAVLDRLHQANDDRRTLSEAIFDIGYLARSSADVSRDLDRIAHICRLPAVQNAMGA